MVGRGYNMGLSSMEWSTGYRTIEDTASRTVHSCMCESHLSMARISSPSGELSQCPSRAYDVGRHEIINDGIKFLAT
jgi:hypothetical protein